MAADTRAKNVATVSSSGVDIQQWAESTTEGIAALTISTATSPPAQRSIRGTSAPLEISIDAELPSRSGPAGARPDGTTDAPRPHYLRRTPSNRDSLRRREALLKGKEGSRRRQKWENDRLIGNPWVEPPEPRDWDVRPTYPVQVVPYSVAPLWDDRKARAAMRANEEKRKAQKAQDPYASVPRELRQRLKRAKGAKGLLQDLEQQVREFVAMWEQKERQLAQQDLADAHSSDEEEIVFVGRNGSMKDQTDHNLCLNGQTLKRDKLILDSLVDDHGAAFGRWLVHTLASYYNLRAWSVTVGNPARREAYVGIKDHDTRAYCSPLAGEGLPRPLWGLV